jgi:DNA-binding transcriptional LysR family regulator
MELQQMRYVVAVAETANFTRAAQRCHVVQSALSHQIAQLERELGARLFERTSRRVRLTAAGEAFLPAARQALEAAERARAEAAAAAGEIRGRLAIGTIPTVTAVDLPEALRAFRQRHPQVRVSLRVDGSETLTRGVREGVLDLAFLGLPPEARPKGVRGQELARDELVAVVAPGHPLAAEPEGTVTLRRLAEEVFVDFPEGSAGRAQSDVAFSAAGLTRDVAFEANGAELLIALVRNGLGVGMAPSSLTSRLAGLRAVRVSDAPRRVEHLVWSSLRPSPAAAAFLAGQGIVPEPER